MSLGSQREQRNVRVNGRQLYIEKHGPESGMPVVLLHHGLGAVASWRRQVPELVHNGYRVLAYDRWGYGKSEPRPALSVPTFEDDLDDLVALLDMLAIDQANLVGHSDGGTIALLAAAQRRLQVASLVTIAAHIYVEPKMQPGIESIRKVFESDLRFQKSLHRQHGHKTEAVFYNWYNGWNRPENMTWDLRSQLEAIKCPALIIQGVDDEHATPRHAEDIAASIGEAELWLVEGARHMVPQENAAEFNARLLAFLASTRSGII